MLPDGKKKEDDMRVLVSVASRHGGTAEIADVIGAVLAYRGFDVSVRPAQSVVSLDPYDAVVIGSAVYMGRWMLPAKELVERHIQELVERPVWLFSSGPVGSPLKPIGEPVDVAGLVEASHAREHHLFPGDMNIAGLGLFERALIKAFDVEDGDYRDWSDVREWANEIADALEAGSQVQAAGPAA